jgi:hypothetical protein
MPSLQSEKGSRRSVTILEDQLNYAVLITAREAYRALGGTEAEWTPRAAAEGAEQ